VNDLNVESVRQIPKVDLHAHLSGSIDQQKLASMYLNRCGKTFETFDCQQDFRSAEEANKRCFEYFDAVSKVVTDLASLRESTREVLRSFAEENCVYLELRTGPKAFKSGNSTPEQYVDVVRECITELNTPFHRMEVKLLLSVKRSLNEARTKEMVINQIDKVLEIYQNNTDLVVGVDVCGNPKDATLIPNILPALMERRQHFKEVPITFHLGEIDDDEECDIVIDHIEALNIRRLGHVVHLKDRHIDRLNALADNGYILGIEMCPTSNQVTTQSKNMRDHHFGRWWRKCRQTLLFSINTDDCGLFSCSVTGENLKLAQGFDLSLKDLCDIQMQSIRSSFHPNKEELIKKVDDFRSTLL